MSEAYSQEVSLWPNTIRDASEPQAQAGDPNRDPAQNCGHRHFVNGGNPPPSPRKERRPDRHDAQGAPPVGALKPWVLQRVDNHVAAVTVPNNVGFTCLAQQ